MASDQPAVIVLPTRIAQPIAALLAAWTVALLGLGGPAWGAPRVGSQSAWQPPEVAARRLSDDAADGHLDDFDFLTAALIASGVESPSRRQMLRDQFDRWWRERSIELQRIREPREQARVLLHALHSDIFRGQYYAACAHVDQTLTQGHFNCVTATVLFHEAALRLGLPDRIVSVPGHVFNRLVFPRQSIDVQTTSSTWLDPQAPRPAVPEGPERWLTEVQLIGKLYYNRGVARLAQHRYRASAQLFRTALAWDPQDQSASQNLLAALNNGALAAAERHRYFEALGLLREGLQFDPQFQPLEANYRHIAEAGVKELLAQARPDAARQLLQEAAQATLRERRWIARQQHSVARWEEARQRPSVPYWDTANDLTTAAP